MDQFLSDNSTDKLYQHASDVKWIPYNKLHVGNFEKVHYDTKSDVVVLKVRSQENTYIRAIQGRRRATPSAAAARLLGRRASSGGGDAASASGVGLGRVLRRLARDASAGEEIGEGLLSLLQVGLG